MISNKILLICLAFIALTACSAGSKKQTNHHMENEKRTLVKLETTMGNITVALYNETPKHRDNFIKLVKEGVYDSTLFHRVTHPVLPLLNKQFTGSSDIISDK